MATDRSEIRTTRNLRSPVRDELPGIGTPFTLPDGRSGWIAGPSNQPGKLVFVQRDGLKNRSTDVWPSEMRGAIVR